MFEGLSLKKVRNHLLRTEMPGLEKKTGLTDIRENEQCPWSNCSDDQGHSFSQISS
jgi:hypothetical protein